MIKIYVLIVAWHVGYGGTAIETQEFNSKTACEYALQSIGEEFARQWNSKKPIGVCVPKTGEE